MTKKLFKSTFLVTFSVLLLTLALIMGVLYDYFTDLRALELINEAELAAVGVERVGAEYLQNVDSGELRLTLIAPDGTVLYDNEADPATMENHADREEVIEAKSAGRGSANRVSATLSKRTLYEARRLPDGSILRVASEQNSVLALLLGMLQPLLLIIVLAVCLAAWISSRTSRRITDPLNALDLEHPLENETYDELAPLLRRLSQQQKQISEQMSELRRRREEFEAVTSNLREGLILLDKEQRIISINPAAARIFSAPRDCVGSYILEIDRSPELRALLDENASSHEADIERQGRNYRLSRSGVMSDGEEQGLVLLAFDVTEKLQGELLRREFTANVSHELKTPLHAIMGSAELLEKGLVKPEDRDEFISRIRSEASRLLALVEDVMDLSRLDEGTALNRECVELLSLAEDTVLALETPARERGISLSVEGEPVELMGVRQLLHDIIYNLCDNGIRYGREGGYVRVSVQPSAEGAVLSVSDNGMGIAPEHQERVFERFYRVDKSHSSNTGGTGLGLSIVKHAAQYHQATLTLESTPGQGTTVTLVFPKQ